MISAPIPVNETSRLLALQQSGLLDSPREAEFDEIVQFASLLCNMPISLISLIDADRQWYKARFGFDGIETARDISFCSHAILNDELFEVRDTTADERFFDNPMVVHDPSIRFYAGMPLITSQGDRLGTLCVIDKKSNELTEQQKFGLRVLANNVIKIAELRIKNKELYYLTETQKRIISILAHDVRNPLSSIKSIIDLKQSEILDPREATDMLKLVSGQLTSTIEMVENVVNWGQTHLKFGELKLTEFDLHQLVKRIFGTEMLNSTVKQNQLINNVDKGTIIYSDERALEFILRNLVSNANKFTSGGTITLNAERSGLKTVLSIKDTGVGMPQEKVIALLTEGNTKSTPGTNNEKGSGLGLILVKEFIGKLNGSLQIKSAPGEGTSFIISI